MGHLTLTPLASSVQAQATVQSSPIDLTLGNDGTALLHFALSCAGGATPVPASGTVASGSATSAQISLPLWTTTGTKTLTCTASTSDGTGGPLGWTLTATVAAAPATGTVGPSGGTVDLLDFVFTGDTRPGDCQAVNYPYPVAAFTRILQSMVAQGAQFGLDLGDHMYVCNQSAAEAQAQMKLYTDALAAQWPASKLWFMTLGNHECGQSYGSGNCLPSTGDANFNAYFAALQSVSQQTAPSYKLDFQTRHGLVRMVVAADNSYSAAAQTQVDGWLTEADASAFATLVVRHHTVTTRPGPPWALNLFKAHKATIGLVAHAHVYSKTSDTIPRTTGAQVPVVVCGLGAADTRYTGFCRLQEQPDGSFKITQFSESGLPQDTFSVQGQQ